MWSPNENPGLQNSSPERLPPPHFVPLMVLLLRVEGFSLSASPTRYYSKEKIQKGAQSDSTNWQSFLKPMWHKDLLIFFTPETLSSGNTLHYRKKICKHTLFGNYL